MISKVQVSTVNLQDPEIYLNSDSRAVSVNVGLKMFYDHFLLGNGPGSSLHFFYRYAPFAIATNGYQLMGSNAILNNHIKILAETGIMGFIFYLCIILYPIVLYLKKIKFIKSKLVDSLLIGYILFLILSMQSQPYFYQKYIWLLYVCLITLIKQSSRKIDINTNNQITTVIEDK